MAYSNIEKMAQQMLLESKVDIRLQKPRTKLKTSEAIQKDRPENSFSKNRIVRPLEDFNLNKQEDYLQDPVTYNKDLEKFDSKEQNFSSTANSAKSESLSFKSLSNHKDLKTENPRADPSSQPIEQSENDLNKSVTNVTVGENSTISSNEFQINGSNVMSRKEAHGKTSKCSEKEMFQHYLDKGESLLASAKMGLKEKAEIREVEDMLYEAADLFSKAVAVDSSSLLALGQWGNTLLVHGELKLKMSQRVRHLLLSCKGSQFRRVQQQELQEFRMIMKKDSVRATLCDLCEECQSLLVEAGSKYRSALSLNKDDIKSLYNWGLALCLQAQLVAAGRDSKAAKHADKLYLAAVDKFEAMMGISQLYAPQVLWNWGLALRDRSRLRPKTHKDRRTLLLEAKQLFQDALNFNPKLIQAEMAMISCTIELEELEEHQLYLSSRQEQRRSKFQ
eukprot:TRINITY_DN2398_c0_g1_i4.p1 TRINITY_DN2398_c0_g1~~TRINITY_DN2398_c0_g1_i4.p1  ORF type:complete len:448 (+),score=112.87 TRINITY_DN2398_c0_g1_i4:213-1556(+)